MQSTDFSKLMEVIENQGFYMIVSMRKFMLIVIALKFYLRLIKI
jgi:hypothetical protein